MGFGERLVETRIENGYTRRNEFAEKLGIPSTTLRNYETGVREPGHKFLMQVSELLNVSIDYLLCATDEKEALSSFRLKGSEYKHIEKYRTLDEHGRKVVDTVLDIEAERIELYGNGKKILDLTDEELKEMIALGGYVPAKNA